MAFPAKPEHVVAHRACPLPGSVSQAGQGLSNPVWWKMPLPLALALALALDDPLRSLPNRAGIVRGCGGEEPARGLRAEPRRRDGTSEPRRSARAPLRSLSAPLRSAAQRPAARRRPALLAAVPPRPRRGRPSPSPSPSRAPRPPAAAGAPAQPLAEAAPVLPGPRETRGEPGLGGGGGWGNPTRKGPRSSRLVLWFASVASTLRGIGGCAGGEAAEPTASPRSARGPAGRPRKGIEPGTPVPTSARRGCLSPHQAPWRSGRSCGSSASHLPASSGPSGAL